MQRSSAQGGPLQMIDSIAANHYSNHGGHNSQTEGGGATNKSQSDQQSIVDENYLSQTMRNLADKAFELSKKHNLKDEVKMI